MSSVQLPPGEIVARGEKIYQENLRSSLEPEHNGKFVIINVETGEYELDEDHLAASDRASARWPDSPRFVAKVGSRTVGRIGLRNVTTK